MAAWSGCAMAGGPYRVLSPGRCAGKWRVLQSAIITSRGPSLRRQLSRKCSAAASSQKVDALKPHPKAVTAVAAHFVGKVRPWR